jgi:hypothetical protein
VARPLDQRSIPTRRLLGNEAIESFNAWRAKTDKIEY